MAKIAVLIPCFNEEVAIGQVVQDFRQALPSATIYVYDNNSKDKTAQEAQHAEAIVREEPLQGKGHVVRRMFADVDADIYIMVDGDNTYAAKDAPKMVDLLVQKNLDMVIGARMAKDHNTHRRGHAFGNRLFNWVVARLFGSRFQDIFSGYRVFSRRFVKSFPALSHGFDIETELSIHCLELNLPTQEIPTSYGKRPPGSFSKLGTFTDGLKIAKRILFLLMQVKPLQLFGSFAALFILIALTLGYPVITHYLETGFVPRLPTAVLSTGLIILGFLSFGCGLILNNVSYGRREVKRLFYLTAK